MNRFKLLVNANYVTGDEEEYQYQTAYEVDDLLGILKTCMEYGDNATSYVFTVVKMPEREDAAKERETEERRLREMDQWEHKEEGTQANFDRYIAGDR